MIEALRCKEKLPNKQKPASSVDEKFSLESTKADKIVNEATIACHCVLASRRTHQCSVTRLICMRILSVAAFFSLRYLSSKANKGADESFHAYRWIGAFHHESAGIINQMEEKLRFLPVLCVTYNPHRVFAVFFPTRFQWNMRRSCFQQSQIPKWSVVRCSLLVLVLYSMQIFAYAVWSLRNRAFAEIFPHCGTVSGSFTGKLME